MLRCLPLLLVVAALNCQELEEFTLADGRKLVGEYDAAAKVLSAHVGGGVIRIAVPPEQIVARARHQPMPPPAPVAVVPPTPPPTPSQPPADPFAVDQAVIVSETRTLEELAAKAVASSEDHGQQNMAFYSTGNALNPMNSTMLRARTTRDDPVRYRFLASLADPVPYELEGMSRSQWVLEVHEGTGRAFGYLLVPRDTETGRAFEKALTKNSLVAAHGWLKRRVDQGVFVSPKMIAVGDWGFPTP